MERVFPLAWFEGDLSTFDGFNRRTRQCFGIAVPLERQERFDNGSATFCMGNLKIERADFFQPIKAIKFGDDQCAAFLTDPANQGFDE